MFFRFRMFLAITTCGLAVLVAAGFPGPAAAITGPGYVVQAGDTLYSIARRYGVTVEAMASANGIDNPDVIDPGRRLLIPGRAERYRVVAGDTLWSIARRFGVQVSDLAARNRLADPEVLRVGQELIIPGVGEITSRGGWLRKRLAWPLQGRLTSGFGRRWGRLHTGVDLAAPAGSAIKASAAGRVVSSGWQPGYGRTVVIEHDNGWRTLYGHASHLLVSPGERVNPGQVIARVGSSGWSTGPHLHFEVLVGNRPLDPLQFLP